MATNPGWIDICATTLRHREGMGDIYAFGVVAEAAKRAAWQHTDDAAIDVICETFDELLLLKAWQKSQAALDEMIDGHDLAS